MSRASHAVDGPLTIKQNKTDSRTKEHFIIIICVRINYNGRFPTESKAWGKRARKASACENKCLYPTFVRMDFMNESCSVCLSHFAIYIALHYHLHHHYQIQRTSSSPANFENSKRDGIRSTIAQHFAETVRWHRALAKHINPISFFFSLAISIAIRCRSDEWFRRRIN